MSEAARDAVILEHTKSLRLPTVGREFPTVSRQARDAGWPYEDHLKELLEREVLARQTRTVERLIKYANFPDLKTLDQIDWKALKGISKPKILELATCGYIEGRRRRHLQPARSARGSRISPSDSVSKPPADAIASSSLGPPISYATVGVQRN